jgi:hypothetical protein
MTPPKFPVDPTALSNIEPLSVPCGKGENPASRLDIPAHDSVVLGVDVGYQGISGTVGSVHEDGHRLDTPDERDRVSWVDETDPGQHDTLSGDQLWGERSCDVVSNGFETDQRGATGYSRIHTTTA